MWSEVNKLSRQSLSQSQIALSLGICRDTVRRYQRMSEAEFNERLGREFQRRRRKLDAYEDFIRDLLQEAQFLSSAQIHDRLKEHFPELPEVSERTVYNTVQSIREREDLPKKTETIRQMSKVPDCGYGEKCHVDYGERWMHTPQDRKMLVKENFGDYIMTEEFAKYVADAGFTPVFCMPFDPASKGLSEATVKYVKGNFLPGRQYLNIDSLNDECVGWLARTANAMPNASTKLVPAERKVYNANDMKDIAVAMAESNITTEDIRLYAKALRLSNLRNKCSDIVHKAQIEKPSYLDFLLNILKSETQARQENDLNRRMRQAKLPRCCDLDRFDFNHSAGITKPKLKQLRELVWLDQMYNLIFMGSTGTGKTFLFSALF